MLLVIDIVNIMVKQSVVKRGRTGNQNVRAGYKIRLLPIFPDGQNTYKSVVANTVTTQCPLALVKISTPGACLANETTTLIPATKPSRP